MTIKEKFVKTFTEQKLRLDYSMNIISIFSFMLLTITASDNIKEWTGISTKALLILIPAAVVFLVWFLGFILDKSGYPQEMNRILNRRNPQFTQIMKQLDEIEKRIDR